MDAETTPTGEWREPYAGRLPLLAALPAPDPDAGLDLTALDGPDDPVTRALAAFNAPFGPPEPTDARVEDLEVPGPHGPIPARVYRPASRQLSGAGLVWFHGGAFIGGDLDMPEADLFAKGLVTRTGCVVVSVFYRLCHDGVHHPVPHDDCWAAFTWTRDHASELGIDPDRVAVGGASAGGNLAASVAVHGRDSGTPPWQALLAYPVVHAPLPAPSPELAAALDATPFALRFPEPLMTFINENYLGGPVVDPDPYAFAGHADDLAGYPPTYIENAEFDDLRASGEAFGLALVEAGVDVAVATAAGVPHGYLNAIGSPLTSASIDRFATRLDR